MDKTDVELCKLYKYHVEIAYPNCPFTARQLRSVTSREGNFSHACVFDPVSQINKIVPRKDRVINLFKKLYARSYAMRLMQ